jgi:hypothetical protein
VDGHCASGFLKGYALQARISGEGWNFPKNFPREYLAPRNRQLVTDEPAQRSELELPDDFNGGQWKPRWTVLFPLLLEGAAFFVLLMAPVFE